MWLEHDWFILQDPGAPGEHLVLESVGLKLSPLWLSQAEAERFVQSSPAAQGMQVECLAGAVLKEAYLRALGLLGVQKLLVGYQAGRPNAFSLELSQAVAAINHTDPPQGPRILPSE